MLVSLFIVFFTIRLPPSSTRTYPLFPDTTPFRSCRDRTARPQLPRCAGKSGARLSLFGIARRRHRLRAPADRPWGQARRPRGAGGGNGGRFRSEEHTSELQSLMRRWYDVFSLKKKTEQQRTKYEHKKTNKSQ